LENRTKADQWWQIAGTPGGTFIIPKTGHKTPVFNRFGGGVKSAAAVSTSCVPFLADDAGDVRVFRSFKRIKDCAMQMIGGGRLLHRFLAVAALAIHLQGCGKTEQAVTLVPVKGVVFYKDKPLSSGQVCFIPDSRRGNDGPMAIGRIQSNGEFTLQTNDPLDGAKVGHHRVVITSFAEVQFDPSNPGAMPTPKSLIPPKYGNELTSQLEAEVKPKAEENSFRFDLK